MVVIRKPTKRSENLVDLRNLNQQAVMARQRALDAKVKREIEWRIAQAFRNQAKVRRGVYRP